MKPLSYYIQKAEQEKWAIGQFNFSDFSEVKGIIQAAQNLKAPIILGTSENESKFFGMEEAVALRDVLRKTTGLPIFLNLDHGKSFEYLEKAVRAGYDMVHFDGSKLSLAENIKISSKVVALAKSKKVIMEGEVGRIGSDASRIYSEKFEISENDLTKVEEVTEYLKKVKVSVLAVSVGTFHGIDITGASPSIRMDRLEEIRKTTAVPLVMHGGSGTPDPDIRKSIEMGVVKININTDLRIAFTKSLRQVLEMNKDEVVPYKYLPEPVAAIKWVVEEKIKLFGSEGKV